MSTRVAPPTRYHVYVIELEPELAAAATAPARTAAEAAEAELAEDLRARGHCVFGGT
jgi:hypothetical protein